MPSRPKTSGSSLRERIFEAVKASKIPCNRIAQGSRGLASAVGRHAAPKQGMVPKAPAIVADPTVVAVVAQQGLNVLAGHVGAFEGSIQFVRVSCVVFAVVDFHGARIDVWFQRVVGVGKLGELKSHKNRFGLMFHCLSGPKIRPHLRT